MDLPFETDYAKSNRAVCRGCNNAIAKNTLRLAIRLQSTTFDGKVPNWYHFACFFIEHMPHSVLDISNYDSLRWEDQQEIKSVIGKGESSFNEETAKKVINEAASKASVENYAVSYSKTSQCVCETCNNKIEKDNLQITKKGTKKKMLRYHLQCFSEKRMDIGFLEAGEDISGFNDLTKDDQEVIKTELKCLHESDVPKKKQRLSEEIIIISDGDESENEEEDSSKMDIKLMYEYRDQLKKYLTKKQLEHLLKYNKQKIPPGIENMLDLSSDMMTFGALTKCPSCRWGSLTYTNFGYKCSGHSSAWSKCTALIQDPIRNPVRIPEELKVLFPFLMIYEYVPRRKKTENIQIQIKPLNYFNFTIFGFPTSEETFLKNEITKLGGRVVSHVKRSVLAVVTTRDKIKENSNELLEAEKCNVFIVTRDFISAVKNIKDQNIVEEIIKKYDICGWGLELNSRIPDQYKKDVKSKIKRVVAESEEIRRKIRVKNGLAVEPESGLDNEAHVYQNGNNRYTAALSMTDIAINKNTYYKIQLLEADNENKYWLYCSWGRIGTDYGGFKVKEWPDLKSARKEFERLFMEKTGNSWSSRKNMVKKPGKFCYVEVDYDASKEEIDLESFVAGSELHPAVAHLIAFIFNVRAMEKLLLEYSLDVKKMPLGKLSKYQIKQAYTVLSEAISLLPYKNKSEIMKCSNKFYSLLPHSSDLQSLPLLDNMDYIKKKLEMLESLYEVETAFCMIQRNSNSDNSNPLDAYYSQLCTNIETLDQASQEYTVIEQYVKNTHADTHRSYNLQILEVFKVKRHEEEERYKEYSNLHNRKLLWHGSRTTNFAGILFQGLRIAPLEAPSTGTMFGKGIYFADMISKSANYCCITPNDPEKEGLLLLCEVALGNVMEKMRAEDVKKLPKNVHSVKGVGQTEPNPNSEVTLDDGVRVPIGMPIINTELRTSLLYNEYIVYNAAQVKVRYLLKMKFMYK